MQIVSPYDEKELLSLLKQNSEQAFEKIYWLYSARLYGNLLKMVKSEFIAQEILQDVFLKIWDHRHAIDPEKSFRSYLFKIAENKVYDFFRKATRDKKIKVILLAAATEYYVHIEEMIVDKEKAVILQKAIEILPAQRKEVFRLCKLEGKSYKEVSEALRISTSTISDHIVKANRSIKEYLFAHLDLTLLIICFSLL